VLRCVGTGDHRDSGIGGMKDCCQYAEDLLHWCWNRMIGFVTRPDRRTMSDDGVTEDVSSMHKEFAAARTLVIRKLLMLQGGTM
jgi:hypothetical protein